MSMNLIVLLIFMGRKKKLLPSQARPVPENPVLHVHVLLPGVFVQFAYSWHPPLFAKHSLLSIYDDYLTIKSWSFKVSEKNVTITSKTISRISCFAFASIICDCVCTNCMDITIMSS